MGGIACSFSYTFVQQKKHERLIGEQVNIPPPLTTAMKGLAARIITALDLMPTSNQLTENQHVINLLPQSIHLYKR